LANYGFLPFRAGEAPKWPSASKPLSKSKYSNILKKYKEKYARLTFQAALAESMSPKDHQPGPQFENAYAKWGSGEWGGVLTGNVMVDERFCGSPGDLIIDKSAPLEKWAALANAIKAEGTPALVQINHPGRQSPGGSGTRGFWDKAIAPSAIALNIGDNIIAKVARGILFGTPREMSIEDIKDTTRRFADAARFLAEAGFDGVELHGAHGYLIGMFSTTLFMLLFTVD
jgi:2,4-dienoyl-CoA reductase-like NADH-dependent reductase (Old Yellow Enzyme family)